MTADNLFLDVQLIWGIVESMSHVRHYELNQTMLGFSESAK